MFCGSCGSEYIGNPKFCGKCGAAIPQTKRITEDNKDKGYNQDKINALKTELKELKAQEEVKKLNSEIDPNRKKTQPFSGPLRLNGFFLTLIAAFSVPVGGATLSKYLDGPIFSILYPLLGGSEAFAKLISYILSTIISSVIILVPVAMIIALICELINGIINSFRE
tara:strand:+ start:79 stop:579 length:501 start_codon:yes stop_codon:yes gene_type:complete